MNEEGGNDLFFIGCFPAGLFNHYMQYQKNVPKMRKKRSTSKTRSLVWVLTVLLTFTLKACGKDKVEYPEGSIIMTTTAKEMRIVLSGSDDIVIHWGDGKKSNLNEGTLLNFGEGLEFSHTYSSAAKRTIYITGKVETLRCDNMQLTALDVSQNPELKVLNCANNQLTELDVSRNPELTALNCSNNQLSTLDVSGNAKLKSLGCNNNQLAAIDVSKNLALEELHISGNQITTLNVNRNTALKHLRCPNNFITSIDVSANPGLTNLNLNRNQLTKLDISKNTSLNIVCVRGNQFTASALNDLFNTLFSVPQGQYAFIDYSENPGSNDADHTIWQEKNWLYDSCR